ncbi:unnamed protein product [Calypogeia fissa]
MLVDSRGPPPEEASQKGPKEQGGSSAQEGRPPLGASQQDLAAGSQRPQVSKGTGLMDGRSPGRVRDTSGIGLVEGTGQRVQAQQWPAE